MSKKFKERVPKQLWTLERTYQRKSLVEKEISEESRELNAIDRLIKHLITTIKPHLQKRLANKFKYKRQLEEQVKEIKERSATTISNVEQKFDITSHDNNSFVL